METKPKHNDYSRKMADYALKKAKEYTESLGVKINTQAKRLPSMIRFNGLAPTFSFYLSKAKDSTPNEYLAVLDIAYDWLKSHSIYNGFFKDKDVHKRIEFYRVFTSLGSQEYRAISHELIQLFDWTRRFTTALVAEHKGGENKNEQK